ncbi:polysaccharide biosynthesis/export family protein [Xanthomonas massiliensis]|uniref:polysaccharide biosynthesis/export family protein n=1 Tax=Xanthomonas massiliensis TaxID=1720302 RepID=UPI000826CB5D|nr:polysaccharide biosynthesis/export family protein [Xanthomonas massiliensis]
MLALGGCASARLSQPANTPLPPADPVEALLNRPEYRVGPSDLLSVTLFQVEDLDREVRVNNAGQISLPLVGVVKAGGLTVDELEHNLAQRYRDRFLQDPQITVFVKEFASQRVTVAGEVKKPGIYPMTSARLSLMQALAMAEGFSNIGSKRNVFIFRTVDGQRMLARFDVDAIEHGVYPDPEISGEDIVLVDRSFGREAIRTLIELTPFVAVWRAYR